MRVIRAGQGFVIPNVPTCYLLGPGASGVPSWYWRDGDVLITRFTLLPPQDLPAGTYCLRVEA